MHPQRDAHGDAPVGSGRMRVLRVIARMNVGGPARQVTVLARGLDPSRFEQRLLVGSVGPDETDYLDVTTSGIDAVRITGLGRVVRPVDDLRALLAIRREISRFRPHVLHTHTAKAGVLGRVAALSLRRSRRPALVHTFHGHLLHGYFSPGITRLVVLIERALAWRTVALVAVGSRVRDELLAAGIGAPEKFAVVPPGISLLPAPTSEDARTAFGVLVDAAVVLFVGRLAPVKRPDRLVEMAARVHKRWPATRFLVVGGGELETDLGHRVAAAGLGEAFVLAGWRRDVEAAYAAADVVVLTSDNEGMPVSLIEAALAGRPAITTDVGSAREVVIDGETGFVVDADPDSLAEAIGRLLADPALAARMGRAAEAHARQRFSAPRLVADTEALYERVMGTEETWLR